jgi:hypothetical protein
MHKFVSVIGCGLAMASGAAQAQTSDFTVSGFGTFSASRLSTNDAAYRTSAWQPNGADKSWTASTDSKVGVQGSYRFNDAFSATISALAQQHTNNTYAPRVEWAYLNFKPQSNLELRVGRLGLPAFLSSDYLNVNYAMTGVRGPVEVYSQLPISHFDGVDALWRTKLGSANVTLQPIFGRSKFGATFSDSPVAATQAVGSADVYGLNVLGELGDWTLRAGYIGAKVTIESDPTTQLVNNLRAMGANTVADRLDYRNKNSSFAGVGVIYDNGSLLGQAEYTQRRAYGFLADTNSWYMQGGYRLGQFTPYVVVAEQKVVSATSWSDVPAPMSPFVNGMLAAGNTSQSSWSLGVRWDFMKNVAAKAQYSRITPKNGSAAGLLMHDASKGALGAQNLLTVSLDSVF